MAEAKKKNYLLFFRIKDSEFHKHRKTNQPQQMVISMVLRKHLLIDL